MIPAPAIVLANGFFQTPNGKAAHGLVRGSERFKVQAVVDPLCAGQDAGSVLDGQRRGIPLVASLTEALAIGPESPQFCVVGIATHGGRFTPELRILLLEAAQLGLSIVNGLHDYVSADAEIAAVAAEQGLTLIDLRKPKPKHELHFWTGAIHQVQAPRLAVLGMDCAIGKRTTARLLTQALAVAGIKAEMIFTGQTGWMQGFRYGFVLDSVVNDYVSGELEHAIVTCDQEIRPDVIILEGQSSLRNPSGPCGAEFLLSGAARGVILQHAPGREFFEGYEDQGHRIPPVEDEIKLIRCYGARTLAVTLQGKGMTPIALQQAQRDLQQRLNIPVVCPLEDGVEALVPVVQDFIAAQRT
ncbi:MAG: DUF1611 domain-containing protein [Candidatus Competibacteraceae bacterium]|jgi:uncharacterized NAD-dependent epimerase/dehydratase family protein|nr:DUF1611 domain-containing protein [Candidatus Competibacteraceae bacterium]